MSGSYNGTMAKVVSAMRLSMEQEKALEKLLSSKLNKQVSISLEIDPSLIGGFYVYVDGLLIDRSVKKRIDEIKESIISSMS
ncbi:MAG: F0F1 ATP synthase subunit delta [Oscillospiraceae bacterium]|nr:F0F1 ATP synthase subunit delta [Oscillospiraceae bacterium]